MGSMRGVRCFLAIAAALACGRSTQSTGAADSARGSAQVRYTPAASSTSSIIAKPACPATGRWAICTIENRLKRAGLVARRDSGDAPLRPGFSVKPLAYALGRDSHLELFIYPDEAALGRDIAKMDTVRVAPAGRAGAWAIPPTLVRSGNLAAVLVTRDAREADRLSLALTAGAPQPAR